MTTVSGEYRRPRWDLKTTAVIVGFGFNLAFLAWGAAVIKTTVDQLGTTMITVVRQIGKMNDKVSDQDGRIRVLEDREGMKPR